MDRKSSLAERRAHELTLLDDAPDLHGTFSVLDARRLRK
jgi:hypothetical protein